MNKVMKRTMELTAVSFKSYFTSIAVYTVIATPFLIGLCYWVAHEEDKAEKAEKAVEKMFKDEGYSWMTVCTEDEDE